MNKLKILLLEDDAADAELIQAELQGSLDIPLQFHRVVSRDQFLQHLKTNKPHLVLSDYRLPQYDGLEALKDLQSISPDLPFIIVTGTLTEEAAADAIKLGAWDYVVKQRLFRLTSAVQNALKLKSEREQTATTEAQLYKSEERFRLISISAQDAIIMMDADGCISFWNPAAERLFGYSEEEIIGQKVHDLLALEEQKRAFINAWPHFGKTGDGHFVNKTVELEALDKNGRRIPVELSLARMELEGKWGAVGIIRDISQRKAAEDALRESEAKYRHLIQHSGDAIYLLYNRHFEVVNEKFIKMFGLTEEDLQSPDFDFSSLIAPKSRAVIEDRLNRLALGEHLPPSYEFTALAKDGREFEVETSVTYMPYKDSWATQGIIRDVTQRKELEAQLRQAQKMEVVGQLAGGVAHDFNNLLTIVSGYCDLLLARPDLDPGVATYIQQINKAGHRARGLTNQLLAFSRKQVFKPVVMDINSAIENSIHMYSRLIGEDIEISLSLEEDLPPILADPQQIEQILMNLLINARDAIHQRNASGELWCIKLSTENVFLDKEFVAAHPGHVMGTQLLLSVSDNGIGMSAEIVSKIFEPFFTTKEPGHGTGLGLSMVYGIVQQNDAEIDVDSKPGQGTTFRIYWPFVQASEEPNLTVETEEVRQGSESILFVEDDEGVRSFAQDALESFGYKFYPAESAEEALALMQKGISVDLLVVDLVLPGISGVEFVEKIHKINNDLPVIYISGYTNDHVLLQTMSRDDTHFIQKPYSMVTLTTRIREVLAKIK